MPTDQWDYVPRDDELGEVPERGPEESALHLDQQVPTPAEDPGRAEVDLADHSEQDIGATYFLDEEPEGSRDKGSRPPAEHTEDLEEILEVQHYAFAPEAAEGDGRAEDAAP